MCIGGRKWRSGRVFIGKFVVILFFICGKEVVGEIFFEKEDCFFFFMFFLDDFFLYSLRGLFF